MRKFFVCVSMELSMKSHSRLLLSEQSLDYYHLSKRQGFNQPHVLLNCILVCSRSVSSLGTPRLWTPVAYKPDTPQAALLDRLPPRWLAHTCTPLFLASFSPPIPPLAVSYSRTVELCLGIALCTVCVARTVPERSSTYLRFCESQCVRNSIVDGMIPGMRRRSIGRRL